MVRPKCPCKRDCPDRSATCHGQCEGYLAYEAEMVMFRQWLADYKRGFRPNTMTQKYIDKEAKSKRRGGQSPRYDR